MGGSQQVGGGEYKNVAGGRTVDQAAAEQTQLERDAPIADKQPAQSDPDVDAPGYSALGLRDGDPVEPNEPA